MKWLHLDGFINWNSVTHISDEGDVIILTDKRGDEHLIAGVKLMLNATRQELDALDVEHIGARVILAKAILRLAPHLVDCDFVAPGQGASVIFTINQTEFCLEIHELWALKYIQAPTVIRMRMSSFIATLFPEEEEEK